MSTQMFLRTTNANFFGTNRLMLETSRQGAATTINLNTTAGGTDIAFSQSWISPRVPFGGLTISGAMTFNVWAVESSMNNNAGMRVHVYKVSKTGTQTEFPGSPFTIGTELGTTSSANNWTGTPSSSVSLLEDERILFVFGVAAVGGTMAAATNGASMTYAGGSAGASGDTYVQFTETFTFKGNDLGPGIALPTYRFRNDDGSETGATWKAAQNTNISVSNPSGLDVNIRLRFLLQEQVGIQSGINYKFQYQKNGGGYTDINNVSSNVRIATSSNYADQDPTTNQLTGGTNSFVTGKMDEDGVLNTAFTITGSNYTELETCFTIRSADVTTGDVLTFKVADTGGSFTYTDGPAGGPPTITITGATTVTKTATLGALLKKTGITKTATLGAAVMKQGLTKTATLGAVLARNQTKTATLGSLLLKTGVTKTATLGSLLLKTGVTKTATLGAVLARNQTKTATLGSLLKKTGVTKTATLGSLVQKQGLTKTATLGGLLVKTSTKTATLSSLLKKTGVTKTATLGSLVQKQGLTKTATLGSLLRATVVKTATVGSLLKKSGITKTATMDARLVIATHVTKTATMDAVLALPSNQGFTRHWTGVLIPLDQKLASQYGWEVFDQFVPTPVALATYTTLTIDTGYDDTLRIFMTEAHQFGPGQAGSPTVFFQLDHWLTAESDPDDFENWIVGNAAVRYLKGRLAYEPVAGAVCYFTQFSITADKAPQTEEMTSQTIAAGGSTITYDTRFHFPPFIQATVVGNSALTVTVHNITATDCRVDVWNTSGVSVGGIVNLTMSGE